MHLIFDGLLKAQVSLDCLWTILEELPQLIGMTVIQGPYLMKDTRETSGWVIIAESHASLHLVDNAIFIDVFSCKEFNIGIVEFYLCQTLPLQAYSQRLLSRPLADQFSKEVTYATQPVQPTAAKTIA